MKREHAFFAGDERRTAPHGPLRGRSNLTRLRHTLPKGPAGRRQGDVGSTLVDAYRFLQKCRRMATDRWTEKEALEATLIDSAVSTDISVLIGITRQGAGVGSL